MDVLKNIYYSPDDPGGFSSIQKLYQRARETDPNISLQQVKEFLIAQPTYTLHRPYRKRFTRNKTIVQHIDYQWQADLADLNDIAAENDGIRYLLTVVDVFSRYAWVVPVARKSGPQVREAISSIFLSGRKPKHLQTDKRKEFFNKEVGALLKKEGVHHFASNSDQKAALVERFNRTLKSRMYKYFHSANTNRYLDILPRLVSGYNSSIHRSIGVAPKDVTKEKEAGLWKRLYGRAVARAPLSQSLQPNTAVRISRVKGIFEKGSTPNWTEETFRIIGGHSAPGARRVYKLEDMNGEAIEGQFYEQEVQRIIPSDLVVIEKMLKKRRIGKRIELLVKWRGWPKKLNSWINQKELIKLQNG